MITTRDFILCSVFALCLPLGQMLFKSASAAASGSERNFILAAVTNPWLAAAFACYALTALLWYKILITVPLSKAYIFSIAGSAFVPVAAWIIFGEVLTFQYAIGCAIMFVGFAIAILSF